MTMPSTPSTEPAVTTPPTTLAPAFNPQSDPPGVQALVDIGFDVNHFTLIYSLGLLGTPEYESVRSSNYQLFPRIPQGSPDYDASAPFNLPATPFLFPSTATMFGGGLMMYSRSSNPPLYWMVRGQFLTQSNVAITQSLNGLDHFEIQVGKLVTPGTEADCGYTPILATHHWSYQPTDLPLQQAVHMRMTLHAYADPAFTQPMKNTNHADDVIGVWVMRTT
jgi:hypothetical protein